MKQRTKIGEKTEAPSGLGTVALLRGVSAKHLKEVEKNSKQENYRQGHIFFRTGEPGKALYILEEGYVRTYRDFGGRKLIISDLKAPAVFGEMGCVGQRVYHCMAEAIEASQVRSLSTEEIDALMVEFPELTKRLLDLVSERFVSTLLELETSSFRDLIPRLAKLLIERATGDWVRDMTHQEIAEHLRVYRESVTSAIGELRKAGIIEVKRKAVKILDRSRLERAAREGA